jgi:hypothetical protein
MMASTCANTHVFWIPYASKCGHKERSHVSLLVDQRMECGSLLIELEIQDQSKRMVSDSVICMKVEVHSDRAEQTYSQRRRKEILNSPPMLIRQLDHQYDHEVDHS